MINISERFYMRKYLFLLIFLVEMIAAVPLFAGEPELKVLGVGGLIATSPYDGVDSTVMPVPVMKWDYKGFYVRGAEGGYSFYDQGGIRLGIVTSPRLMGYHSDDSTALNGMEDRRLSWDAGVKAEIDLSFVQGLSLSAQILNDVLSRYDGREGRIALKQSYVSRYFRCSAEAGAKVQSRQLTDYYYGVGAAEARGGRSAYAAGTAVNPLMGLMLTTGVSRNWLIIGRVEVERLDSTIRKSPIVSDSYTVMGTLGIARRF